MAKTKGQEAANRARAGKANRKSAATQERLGSGWLSIPKNPVELLKEAGSEIKGFVDYQQKLYVNPLANKVNQGITAATGGKVKFQKLKEPTKQEVATEIAGQLAGAAAGKVVGYAANTIARSGAGAAVRNFVSENTPVLRRTMLNAVDAERQIARSAFQREADIMTRRWSTEMAGMKRMLEGSQKNLAKSEMRKRSYREGFMDLYETTEPAYIDMVDQNDLSKLTRGQINQQILKNAKTYDLADDILGTARPAEKMAEKYLKAKAEVIKDSIKYLTPEQKQKALQNQLGKTIIRRQNLK